MRKFDKFLRKQLLKKVEDYLKRLVENGQVSEDNYELIIEQIVNSLVRGEELKVIAHGFTEILIERSVMSCLLLMLRLIFK